MLMLFCTGVAIFLFTAGFKRILVIWDGLERHAIRCQLVMGGGGGGWLIQKGGYFYLSFRHRDRIS